MDTIHRFDRAILRAALADLAPRHRTTFALLCATRLSPAFQHPTVTPDTFRSYHARLWQHILSEPIDPADLQTLHRSVERLLPDEEGDAPHAEDAIAALLFAYECAIGADPADAAWAAERAYNTLDAYVQASEDLDPGAPGGEDAILRHPLIQAELRRQQQDIRALQGAREFDLGLLSTLRTEAESANLFG